MPALETNLAVFQAEIRGELRTMAAEIKGLIGDHHAEEMAKLSRLERDTSEQWGEITKVQQEVTSLRSELKGRGYLNGRGARNGAPEDHGYGARLLRAGESETGRVVLLVLRWKAALLTLAMGVAVLGHLAGWWDISELRGHARGAIGLEG